VEQPEIGRHGELPRINALQTSTRHAGHISKPGNMASA
jgi:hypothetical protein